LNDGQIQNPSNAFGVVPLSRFVLRGFGFVHHSIAILYHEVPNLSITIRNFYIAVGGSPAAQLPPMPQPSRVELTHEMAETSRNEMAETSRNEMAETRRNAAGAMLRGATSACFP
jgi:hypothetical protein